MNNLQAAIIEGRSTYNAKKEEIEAEEKVKKQQLIKAEAEAREKRISSVIGDLGVKIKNAAKKGVPYVDIRINDEDMVTDRMQKYTNIIRTCSKSYEAYEFLKNNFEGLSLRIFDDIINETGAYGEELVYHDFYIRINFSKCSS